MDYVDDGDIGGTLTVTDGTDTAVIALLGQYVAANFKMGSNGAGGTLVTDPPVGGSDTLFPPH
jgi:hypothetical protein